MCINSGREYPVHKSGVVLVTGASTGIGHDAALALAKKEPKLLVFAGVRSKEAGKAIDALGLENLKPLTLDVTSDKSVDSAYKAIAKESRGLPFVGLVNNAGVSAVRASCLPLWLGGWRYPCLQSTTQMKLLHLLHP